MSKAPWYVMPFLCLVFGTQGAAAEICWIGRVEKTATGVNVHFSSPRSVTLRRIDGSTQAMSVDPGASLPAAADADKRPRRAVAMEMYESLSSNNSPHDGCRLSVTDREGRIGILAEAWFSAPHIPNSAQQVSKFIPAE
jgi:hypothetical protein